MLDEPTAAPGDVPDESKCRWAHALPNIDPASLAEADAIAMRTAQAREALGRCFADEAALFMRLYHSRGWSPDQMIRAIRGGMDPEVKYHLPATLPPQRRSPRRARPETADQTRPEGSP